MKVILQKKLKLNRKTGDKIFWGLLVSPAVLVTTFFILIPIIDSIIKSFLDYRVKNIISGEPGKWNNFQNYISLLQDNKIIPAILHTFIFVIFVVLVGLVLGMVFALILLNINARFSRFIRSIMMTPWIVPTVISALIWMWIFQPQYGLSKYIVSFITGGSISDFAMLNNTSTALLGIGVVALWKQIPLITLLLLSGLQNVREDLLEAASIDGANSITKFFRIILPCLSGVIKIVVSLSIIDNFKQLPLFWIMTGGGPYNSTTTLAILSYREAFVSMNLGSGAAVTTIWILLIILVIIIFNRVFRTVDM